MRYRYLPIVCLLISTIAFAQKKADPAVYAKTITANDLKTHLTIIAGPEMEGRNTPSPGLEKAAEYISSQFKKNGLQPSNNGSYRQTYAVSKDSATYMELKIGNNTFTPYEDFAPGMFMPAKADMNFSEYIFTGYGITDENHDDYKGVDVKGKLVIFLNGEPAGYKPAQTGRRSPASLMNKVKNAREKGAAAILIIREDLPSRLTNFGRYRLNNTNAENYQSPTVIPVFYINENVVEKVSGHGIKTIISALGSQIAVPMVTEAEISLKYNTQSLANSASNILGTVEGSDKKDEYLIITAHYDHVGKDADGNIYYGADDDGSGTVSVMEIAEAFAKAKKEGKGPRRTIIFMTVSGEEKGLWGSEYYAAHPIFPLDKTTADLNIDMIGRIGNEYLNQPDAENYVYVIGDNKLSTDLTPILENTNDKYTRLKLDKKYNDPNDPERFYYRSDHYNFAVKGVPVIFFFNGVHADYHKPTDTIDKINFDLMAKRAQLIFHLAWEMANRDEMIKRDLKLD